MRVKIEEIRKKVEKLLVDFGENKSGSVTTADCLLFADKRGISTHGIHLLDTISKRIKADMLSLPTKLEIIKEYGATTILDGGNGLGPVAGKKAIDISIEKAKEFGIGVTLVRNTNNIGSLGYYTNLAVKQKMIAVMSCNAAPAMAPWGGSEKYIGTNPFSIAFPTEEELCFNADLASSVVARGKIRKAIREKDTIPDNWALDDKGFPTKNPEEGLKGTVLPMGGPKGSALAMAIDITAGLLSGSNYGPNLKSFHVMDGPTGVGLSCIVIDISRFMEYSQFEILLGKYIREAKNLEKAEGTDEILMPGEIEKRKEKTSDEIGIELDEKTLDKINMLLKSPIK